MTTLCLWGDVHPGQLPPSSVVRQITGGHPIICNLEAPLTTGPAVGIKATHLQASPDTVVGLREAGVVGVHIANNHMLDAGEAGLRETLTHLRESHIEAIGLLDAPSRGKLVRMQFGGLDVGLLGYGESCLPPLAPLEPRDIVKDVRAAKAKCDRLIVSLHWGIEYVPSPSPAQQRMARQLVQAGADLVIGHHTHVTSPVESYASGFIAYGLGNAALWVSEAEPFAESRTGLQLRYDMASASLCLDTIQLGTRPGVLSRNSNDRECVHSGMVNSKWSPYLREAGPVYLQSQWRSWRRRLEDHGSAQTWPLVRWIASKRFLQMSWGWLLASPRKMGPREE